MKLGNSQKPSNENNRDIELATFNASVANLGANLVILGHIKEQIALSEKSMADQAKFNRELLQLLETIIKNQ